MSEKNIAEDLYERYIEDVINRNEKSLRYKEKRTNYWAGKPLDVLSNTLKQLMKEETEYRKQSDFDFSEFHNEAIRETILFRYGNHPDVKKINDAFFQQKNNFVANFAGEELKQKLNMLQKVLHQKADSLYPKFSDDIKKNGYLEEYYCRKIVYRETENKDRELIQKEFGKSSFDPERDNGNCAKGIVVSLHKMQKEHDIQLFPPSLDMEEIIHPSNLVNHFKSYTKQTESGFLKDVPEIKKGDIVILTSTTGTPTHAMMCHGNNSDGHPVLLGFSSTDKNLDALTDRQGNPRRGMVIDVKGFVADKVNQQSKDKIYNKLSTRSERE